MPKHDVIEKVADVFTAYSWMLRAPFGTVRESFAAESYNKMLEALNPQERHALHAFTHALLTDSEEKEAVCETSL